MDWRLANCLDQLRLQVDQRWPDRAKDSDGTIGDTSHQHRVSDHDPDENGVVTAIDFTHDPQHGFDSYVFADVLRASMDPRIKYVISNRRICSTTVDPWKWRGYHGTNPHDHHIHVSVFDTPALYDDSEPWQLDVGPDMPGPKPIMMTQFPVLRKGAVGGAVRQMQSALSAHGLDVKCDGDFGAKTDAAVRHFQTARGVTVDGVCGPQTWNLLRQA